MAAKSKSIIVTKAGILFTSAGPLRCGGRIRLPAAEADAFIKDGHADKVTVRRKKKSVDKNVDTGDSGGNGNTAREPDNQEPPDA